MTPDMRWDDDDAIDTSAPCQSSHPVLEGLLIVLLFAPIVWVVLGIAEAFR
jgi:hypothetical protein